MIVGVISGPSGAGKGEVVKGLLKRNPSLKRSVSWTTRECRPGEKDGVDYHFVSVEEFERAVKADEFFERAVVHGYLYGTHRSVLSNMTTDVILEIDVQGAMKVKRERPNSHLIFVAPPSYAEMARRLHERNRDSHEEIARRLTTAAWELQQVERYYDCWTVNDQLPAAIADVYQMLNVARMGHRAPLFFRDVEKLNRVRESFPTAVSI